MWIHVLILFSFCIPRRDRHLKTQTILDTAKIERNTFSRQLGNLFSSHYLVIKLDPGRSRDQLIPLYGNRLLILIKSQIDSR